MYARIDTNNNIVEYPIDDIRARFPNTSLPVDLTILENLPNGYVYVKNTSQPVADWDENAVELDPVYDGSGWAQAWELQPASQDEITQRTAAKAIEIRSRRNALLVESDWTQLADSPTDKTAWATYRQALRDVTTQQGFPWEVSWPVEP